MTNFKKIVNNMTPETLAELGVKLINVNNRDLYYMTSSGQLFYINDYQSALQHEYRWLMQDDGTELSKEASPETSSETDSEK